MSMENNWRKKLLYPETFRLDCWNILLGLLKIEQQSMQKRILAEWSFWTKWWNHTSLNEISWFSWRKSIFILLIILRIGPSWYRMLGIRSPCQTGIKEKKKKKCLSLCLWTCVSVCMLNRALIKVEQTCCGSLHRVQESSWWWRWYWA